MDMIYQTIKNLLKAVVNLFVAVIELISGVFNWLASLLLKLRPNESGTNDETTEGKSTGDKLMNGRFTRIKSVEVNETLVQQVRDDLKERITTRDAYILAKAGVEVFEQSHIKKAFAGHRKKLINSITKELLETEFQNSFPAESVEAEAEDTKIQAICEVGKEAIG